MASLKFIMDVDDDELEARQNKRDKDPAPAPSSSRLGPDPSSSSSGQAYSSHVSSPTSQTTQRNIGTAVATAAAPSAGIRRNPSSSNRPTRPATASSATLSRPSARRRSTTSNDSMDQTGYGSAASSSSRGAGPPTSNSPMRPMPNPAGPDVPVKLTPITGRVSRARKGVPVHTCDICKPPKTFTRAEHLRRHQLSHQTPGYPCDYPLCGRAFHRPDLLSRHQQRHEQEGDKGDKGGDEDGGRLSLEESLPRLGIQSQPGSSPVMPGPPAPGTSGADTPSTPNTSTNAPGFQHLRSPGDASNPSLSPRNGGAGGHYNFSPQGTHDYQYSPSPSVSAMSTSPNLDGSPMGPPSYATSMEDSYQQPRSTPSIFVVTQGLSLPSLHIPDAGPPELYHHDASPWASSASDSTYSTPASDISRNHRYWVPPHRSPTGADWPSAQLLSPYPNTVPREAQSAGPSLDNISAPSSSLFMDGFPPSSHFSTAPQNDAFGAVLGVPMSNFTPTGQMPSPSSASTFRPHHHQHDSVSSLGSPTSPHITTSHAGEALVAPMRALPDRLNAITSLGRQKQIVLDVADVGHPFMGDDGSGFDILSGLDDPLGDGSLGRMGCEGGRLTLDLPPATRCGLPAARPAAGPLPRAVCTAIPRYVEIYWRRFHPLYPIVHRPTFEATGNDVLRCAMAAVATQYIESKEDRLKGNQLHEYAWQEVKRIPQWNLQVLQAILLCDLFARFRGRKAVTRPSKQFESLYSRVLYNNPTMFDSAITPTEQHLPRENRWQAWLDAEARRRLVTACFIVDVHTSIYQQQRRAQDYDLSRPGATPSIPLTARSAALWEASSAVEWAGLLAADPEAGNPTFIPPPSAALAPENISGRPDFDRAAILAHELLRLPRRPSDGADLHTFFGDGTPDFDMDLDPLTIDSAVGGGTHTHTHSGGGSALTLLSPVFPLTTTPALPSPAEERFSQLFAGAGTADPRANVYLALHHTPLHDLLAVSGDTWIFSQKVLTAALFAGHQQRTKAWAGQQHAVSATVYAARAILGFLAGPENGNNAVNDGGRGEATSCLTDITDYWGLYVCALVCWAFGHAARRCTGARGRNGNGDMRRTNGADVGGDGEALAWLRLVARARWPGQAGPVIDRREENPGVIRLVRRKLERDCVGGRSRLYVDALGVLKKLEEEDNRKWF